MRDRLSRWRPLHSVSSRIIFFVLAVTLVTSLVVSSVSVGAIHAFLYGKIEQKFPTILSGAVERLDLWYSQRTLDVQTFARRDILVQTLTRLKRGGARDAQRAVSEIREYLAYVLKRFPQYEALLLLDAKGATVLTVGGDVTLPTSVRARLARASDSTVSDALQVGERWIQIASTGVEDASGRRVGSLHALLRVEALRALLHSDDLGDSGEILVVTGNRTVLIGSGQTCPAVFRRPLPEPGAAPVVDEYESERGQRVVGSAVRFPRFGWTVAVEERYEEAFEPIFAVIWRVLRFSLGAVLLVGAVAYRITRSIVAPIETLSEGAQRISNGEHDVVIPIPRRKDEVGLLTRTFNEMVAKLNANRSELQMRRIEIEAANEQLRSQNQRLQRANEALSQLSITDGLTKLHNHRFFQEHLSREISRVKRAKDGLSLILIDIDDFKGLNENHGHAGGDSVLRRIAEVMNEAIRDTDLLARYGGDEFAALASQTDLKGATILAEKIRMAVSGTEFVIAQGQSTTRVTVSIGISTYRGDRTRFFNDADRALYEAKRAGKDCVVIAKGQDRARAGARKGAPGGRRPRRQRRSRSSET